LRHLAEHLEFKELTNSLRITLSKSIRSILSLDKSSIQDLESQSQFRFLLTMDLEMKLIHWDMFINFYLISQRKISSNMLTMTRKYSDIQPDSTPEYLKILREDSLSLSILLMIQSLSLSQLRRIQGSWKANS